METVHFITGKELLFHIRSRSDLSVETIAIRDAIQAWRRRWGMTVGVWDDEDEDNNGIYLLKRGLVSNEVMDNDNWDKMLTVSEVIALSQVVDDITLEGEGLESDPFRIKNLQDGKLYGIKNGAFFEITGLAAEIYTHFPITGSGAESDPVRIINLEDGKTYAIKDGDLIEIPGGGGDADDLVIPKVPTTNKTARGVKTKFIANENQAFGDVCRVNDAGKAQIADATIIATATGFLMCIDETVEADAEGNYLMYGFVRNDDWDWDVGEWVYLSREGTTGGTLTQTNMAEEPDAAEDNVIQVIGVANTDKTIFFNPQLVQVEYRISSVEE